MGGVYLYPSFLIYMKYLILILICLLSFSSCVSKGDFVDFFPDSYFYLHADDMYGDPLTIRLTVPGQNDYTEWPFYVYRAEIVAVSETKDVMGTDSYIDIPVHITYFTLHVTYNYSTNETVDRYVTSFLQGTEAYQKYGLPLPKIGDTLILSEINLDIAHTYGINAYFYVMPGEEDIEYCYSYYIDTSCFTGGIELVGEERHVYKKGRDDDVIKYLKENNIRMPEMTYKFKLEDLVPQLIELNRPRNEALENGTFKEYYEERKMFKWIEYDYGEEGDSE